MLPNALLGTAAKRSVRARTHHMYAAAKIQHTSEVGSDPTPAVLFWPLVFENGRLFFLGSDDCHLIISRG